MREPRAEKSNINIWTCRKKNGKDSMEQLDDFPVALFVYDYQSETVCSAIARGDFCRWGFRNHPSIKKLGRRNMQNKKTKIDCRAQSSQRYMWSLHRAAHLCHLKYSIPYRRNAKPYSLWQKIRNRCGCGVLLANSVFVISVWSRLSMTRIRIRTFYCFIR